MIAVLWLAGLLAALPAAVRSPKPASSTAARSTASAPAREAPSAPGGEGGPAASGKPGAEAPAAAPVPPTHVEAANIEYLYKERRTVMTGKPLVILRRDDATLVCRRMVADNDEAGDIRHATCEGDVKMTRGDQVVTCQHATYDAPTGTIVCRGDTVLHDGPSVITSPEVTYDLVRDRVVARSAKGTVYQRPGQKLPGAREKAR